MENHHFLKILKIMENNLSGSDYFELVSAITENTYIL
jgi:hypothetical protein